ncbi:MAG: hypothetical protein QGM50_06995, partial [Anaerolineae bacterium]|nr:hypothetical protein [Anaerolineae bacterium]
TLLKNNILPLTKNTVASRVVKDIRQSPPRVASFGTVFPRVTIFCFIRSTTTGQSSAIFQPARIGKCIAEASRSIGMPYPLTYPGHHTVPYLWVFAHSPADNRELLPSSDSFGASIIIPII